VEQNIRVLFSGKEEPGSPESKEKGRIEDSFDSFQQKLISLQNFISATVSKKLANILFK